MSLDRHGDRDRARILARFGGRLPAGRHFGPVRHYERVRDVIHGSATVLRCRQCLLLARGRHSRWSQRATAQHPLQPVKRAPLPRASSTVRLAVSHALALQPSSPRGESFLHCANGIDEGAFGHSLFAKAVGGVQRGFWVQLPSAPTRLSPSPSQVLWGRQDVLPAEEAR